jgi:hypothetical protein
MDELKKLRQAARRAKLPAFVTGTMQSWDAIQDFRLAANPEAILGLLDRLEKAERMSNAIAAACAPELIAPALKFYTDAPDGQYDHDVVMPVLEAILAVAQLDKQETR